MDAIGKTIILIGVSITIFGLIIILGSKIGIGKLPGDIFIKRHNMTIYFPLASSIFISLILSFIINFLFRR